MGIKEFTDRINNLFNLLIRKNYEALSTEFVGSIGKESLLAYTEASAYDIDLFFKANAGARLWEPFTIFYYEAIDGCHFYFSVLDTYCIYRKEELIYLCDTDYTFEDGDTNLNELLTNDVSKLLDMIAYYFEVIYEVLYGNASRAEVDRYVEELCDMLGNHADYVKIFFKNVGLG